VRNLGKEHCIESISDLEGPIEKLLQEVDLKEEITPDQVQKQLLKTLHNELDSEATQIEAAKRF